MAAIFLSYAREDGAIAERLARVLEDAGHEVWWDRHIGTGRQFSAEIEAALEKADLVLVAWSKQAAKSPWVRDEAAIGRDTGRLLPVLIDGGQPPIGFRQFQALDLSRWRDKPNDPGTKALTAAVAAHFSGEAPQFAPTARRAWPRWRRAGAAALILLPVLGVAGALYITKVRDDAAATLSKPSIALLPFTAASSDPEVRQLGLETRDSIAHAFAQSGLPLRLADAATQDGQRKADFLISGVVSTSGDMLVATVRLDEGAHGVTVFSHRFEAPREELRNLPERIAAQMAGNLAWRAPLMILDRRNPLDPALIADLLESLDFTGDIFGLQAYQNAKRAAAKAPEVAIAQIGLAFSTGFVLDQIPREERLEALAVARRAAESALKRAPDYGDAHGLWCVLHSDALKVDCEDRLLAGKRVDPDAPFLNTFLAHLLRGVGRFEEALQTSRLAHTHDLYVPTKLGWMLGMQEYEGDQAGARELYRRGVRWWPEYQPFFFRNRLSGLLARGDFDAIRRVEEELGPANLPEDYSGSGPLVAALKARSADSAKQFCVGDAYWLQVRCMLVLGRLGDLDGAYAIADPLFPRRIGRTPAETERIWVDQPVGFGPLEFITSPAAAPMRRDPRFVQLAERTGLLAYWRSGRTPDFCRKNPEPVCRQLLRRS